MTSATKKNSGMSKRNLVIGITFAAGLAFGIVAVIAIQNLSPQNKHATQDVAQPDVQLTSTKSADGASTAGTVDVGQFQDIFKHPTVFDQNAVLYTTLFSATEQELKDWWIQSQKIERKSHRETVQDAILRKLTAINPKEALRYIEDVSKFQTDALLMSVFSEWSVSQLDGAIGATTSLSGRQRNVALQAILETRDDLSEGERLSISKQLAGEETFLKLVSDAKASQSIAEPQESWDVLLSDDVDDNLQTESLAIVAEAWREQVGFEVLSNIYAEIEDYQSKFHLVEAIVQVDLAGALDYTRGLLEEDEQLYLSRIIVREWASTDAQATLAAVSTFEPSSLASTLESSVATTWSHTNPDEAIENIEVLSEQFRLRTLQLAFMQIAREDPMDAIAKLSSVENFVGNTSTIVESIVNEWSRQEPDTAADWVVNNFAREDPQRRRLLEKVLPSLTRQDPNRAFELALEHPTPTGNIGLDYYVIVELARDGDIEVAKKFLPRVQENSKEFLYASVGEAMVEEAQTGEALELGKDLDEAGQKTYYRLVFSTWAKTFPNDLYESLEDLQTSSIQSSAAMQVILSNLRRPLLTDDQIEHARTLLSSDDEAILKRIEENR